MNRDEQGLIQNLFGKLADAERTAPPRDGEADRFIQESVSRQPGAPYYMAQTIIVQEQALEAAQARIQELEAQGSRSQGSGGLLGSLFGSGSQPARPAERAGNAFERQPAAPAGGAAAGGAWGGRGPQAAAAPSRGGGFLAGAAQTAVGVAGGMMLGSMLGGMFAGDGAGETADAGDTGGGEVADASADDGGFDDFGGGFDEI